MVALPPFAQIIRSVAGVVLESCAVVGGLGIVENAYDETAHIAAVAPGELEAREKELLVMAKQWMPRLPFRQADLLIIDEIGKNISGSGMDTNVVGRKFRSHAAADDEWPKIKLIMVRALTEETHGNGTGIGQAEFASKRVHAQIDMQATTINCLTGGSPIGAMLPVALDSDQDTVDAALGTLGLVEPPDTRLMWIRNTLQVAEVECSRAYLEEASTRDDLEILSDPRPLRFAPDGELAPLTRAAAAL